VSGGAPAVEPRASRAVTLGEMAGFFLRLGFTAFGGPAAHLAIMESEAVRRRGWLSRQEFLDRLGAVSLLPGPTSTQMALALGQAQAGVAGLALGGLCFILPSALMAGACAWAYQRWAALPQAEGFLYGVRPVIVARRGRRAARPRRPGGRPRGRDPRRRARPVAGHAAQPDVDRARRRRRGSPVAGLRVAGLRSVGAVRPREDWIATGKARPQQGGCSLLVWVCRVW
jgi:hypothetical protein